MHLNLKFLSLEEVKRNLLDCDLNLKLCGKKLELSNQIRYLSVYLDEYLNWFPYINHLSQKLVKAYAILCKIQRFLSVAIVRSIYQALFHFHLSYVCTVWSKNMNSKHCINLLRKKAMRNISFASFDAHKLPIFGKLNLIKFSPNLISFCNCLFIYKHFLSSILFMSIRSQNGHFRKNRFVFSNLFVLTYDTHEKNTRLVSYGLLKKRS